MINPSKIIVGELPGWRSNCRQLGGDCRQQNVSKLFRLKKKLIKGLNTKVQVILIDL